MDIIRAVHVKDRNSSRRMKVLVLGFLLVAVTSAVPLGSGPYAPSGWKPDGPAFPLPGEAGAQPSPDEPLKESLSTGDEAQGSDQLREYGTPKLEEPSQDLTKQGLPDEATEQAFDVKSANPETAPESPDDGIQVKSGEEPTDSSAGEPASPDEAKPEIGEQKPEGEEPNVVDAPEGEKPAEETQPEAPASAEVAPEEAPADADKPAEETPEAPAGDNPADTPDQPAPETAPADETQQPTDVIHSDANDETPEAPIGDKSADVPEENAPESAPTDDKPAEDKPADETPSEDKPVDESPAEDKPAEKSPAEDKPAEESPSEDKPAEESPAEDKPAEESPSEDKPAEESPAEEKPAEESPAEDKPAEESPSEDKPAEESPAEDKPAEENPAEKAQDTPSESAPTDGAPDAAAEGAPDGEISVKSAAPEGNDDVENIEDSLKQLDKEVEAAQNAPTNGSPADSSAPKAEVPQGFLEYGPPGFTEYGPPKEDQKAAEEPDAAENEARRRRFSPKFVILAKAKRSA